MQKKLFKVIIALLLAAPIAASAQSSSLNAFSPYTFYGIGDLHTPATAASAGMGSVGLAAWSPYSVNLLNPAAYSAVMRKSFIFDIGMSGKSSYLRTTDASSAYNGFGMNNIAVQFPLAKGIGIALNITPMSSVGYRVQKEDLSNLMEIGHVLNTYSGEGNISQFKAGTGFKLFKELSLGVDFVYYLGTITRSQSEIITPLLTSENIGSISIRNAEEISKASVLFGAQYDMVRNSKRILTLGATYQPRAKMDVNNVREMATSNSLDSIYHGTFVSQLDIPEKFSAGIFYRTSKFGTGFDYSTQDWQGAFAVPEIDAVTLTKAQNFNFGMQYTPNRYDVRNRLKRWTYRVGARYSELYLVKNGHQVTDMSVTAGLGIPLKFTGNSQLDIGVEVGRRGTTSFGLVQDNYFKISVGVSLFGEDQWFVKRKYY